MYIIILSLLWATFAHATISYLESYTRPKTSTRTLLAGEIHDADHMGQRQILKQALVKYAAHTQAPLILHVEDPLAIPGLEQLTSPKGLLLGLVKELKEASLPPFIQVKNFDTKKAANCAIHFFCQAVPKLTASALDELRFGDLITELEQVRHSYADHVTLQNLGALAKNDCARQLAAITRDLDLLQRNLTHLRISAGDSMAQTAISLTKQGASALPIYKPLYEADVNLTSLAAIVTTFESKDSMALLCGERHAKDVSRILEYEQWTDLRGPYSFTSDWLLHAIGN